MSLQPLSAEAGGGRGVGSIPLSEKTPMRTLPGLLILCILVHGFNSIVVKIAPELKSGFKYWRETSKK